MTRAEYIEKNRDLLLDYEWPNLDEHDKWVASAPLREIRQWVNAIRADERAEADAER